MDGETDPGRTGREPWFEALRGEAAKQPLGVDISDFSDEFCAGFLRGQANALEHLVRSRDESQEESWWNEHLRETTGRRVRMDLSRGGYMDVSLSPDASPETIAALRALGEAALNRMGEPAADLIGKNATIVGYSETGDAELGFVAHVCLDIEDGLRVFFQAADPAATWRIVEEPRAANSQDRGES